MFTVHGRGRATPAATPVKLLPYGLISRTGTPHVGRLLHPARGPDRRVSTASLQEVKYASTQARQAGSTTTSHRRLARLHRQILADRADPAAGRSGQGAASRHTVEGGVDRYQVDYLGRESPCRAGGTAQASTRFFAGAKEVNLLDATRTAGIPHFDRAIDFGWFYFLTKPIF